MAKFIIVILAIFLSLAMTTEALHCYACGHWGKADTDIEDDSCKAGREPDSSLKTDCASLKYISIGEGMFIGSPKDTGLEAEDISQINPNGEQVTYSCIKATMDGKPIASKSEKEAAIRTCLVVIGKNETLPDVCYAEANSKLQDAIEEDWLKIVAGLFQRLFTADARAGICSCSADNCNGALSSVNVSGAVLLATTLVTIFGKYF